MYVLPKAIKRERACSNLNMQWCNVIQTIIIIIIIIINASLCILFNGILTI